MKLVDFIGSGSTRPEVKSAPESSRPWVNSALVNSARCIFRAFSYIHVYDIRFGVLHNLSDEIKDEY